LSVFVKEKDDPVRNLRQGEAFGEMALLYNAPRSATVKCLNECKLWGVDRVTFRKALETNATKEFEENRKFIDNISFFGN
jgi:cGMP-dependent protein kinase